MPTSIKPTPPCVQTNFPPLNPKPVNPHVEIYPRPMSPPPTPGGSILHSPEQVEPPWRAGGGVYLHGRADGEGRPGLGRAARGADAARARRLLQGHGVASQRRGVHCIREVRGWDWEAALEWLG